MQKLFRYGIVIGVLALVACSSSTKDGEEETDGTGTSSGVDGTSASDGTDGSDGTTGTTGKGSVCTPGDFKACSEDRKSAIVCNDVGDGYENRACKDADGNKTICHPDRGRPL